MKGRNSCTGCGACAEFCPRHAITMHPDDEGFLQPVTDVSLCINCGACHRVCSKYDSIQETVPLQSYSAYAMSPTQRESGSSGGIFGVIAEKIISSGGVVFGAIFSSEEKKVLHTSTQHVSLDKLKRSKYAQSDTKHTFSEVKDLLKAGVKVLYVGTPCEIEGLKAFLNADHENLITMDFVCHGVPSPKFFYDSLLDYEKKEGEKITDFTFREKKLGWRKQAVNVYFANGSHIQKKSADYYYYYYFLRNYTLRESCYACDRYKKHVSDITVADYWTVPKHKDDDKGISLVYLNSEQGKTCFDAIKKQLCIEPYEEQNLERFSHKKYDKTKRNAFFAYYCKNGGKKTISKYSRKMKAEKSINKIKNLACGGIHVIKKAKKHIFTRGASNER